ncbi:MAG: RNA-metabolising metallo-beta-lactamase [candidate division WS6 bacterium GW2011_GWF2_39_15]|uniref:RNA-metabolising metallo-beta-lactamase n=1 Tax=candidate division WS6 bacterium GW2011_GWF2_39_15 TaxID=1619100 RepID=A0A0G0Q514_9BACT|nr:MAG: RNA-metabolising metallo-beta-lactamase [candidate division WS6 bacterium GW2011_GWF2_39_15]
MNYFKRKDGGLTLCTLSGTNETGGRNCNYIEYNNQILVIDAGFSFPGQEMYGIDYLIPSIKELKAKRKNIKAILITHGHLDHIGAIPYIIEDLGFPPIYAGPFAIAIMKEKLIEKGLDRRVKFVEIKDTTQFKLGDFDIQYITTTHSIPDSFSIFVKSPEGSIFFSGDYKIDEELMDIEALNSIKGKVDLALYDSTNVYREGRALPEQTAVQTTREIIQKHKGRIIVAAFASLVTRLASMIKIAQETNRKVVLSGRSLHTTMRVARYYKYIDVNDSIFITEKQIKNYPDDQIMILSTGSQGERYAALNRIALGEHLYIKGKPGDLVIMSASEVPGNEEKIGRMTDLLIRQGMDLINNAEASVHSSGHGLQEDMKILNSMLNPKYIMPIHGSLTFRYQSKKNYINWGHNPNDILLTEDGQTWTLNNSNVKRGIKVESKPILIDGLGVGDIGDIVLKDRAQLSQYGMFCVILNISQKTKQLLGRPRFISRGFVYMKTSQNLLKEIENIVVDVHRKWLQEMRNSRKVTEQLLYDELERNIARYIRKKTEREPIILPVII